MTKQKGTTLQTTSIIKPGGVYKRISGMISRGLSLGRNVNSTIDNRLSTIGSAQLAPMRLYNPNNPALYDSVLGSIAGCNGAWLTDQVQADYLGELNAAVAVAQMVDTEIAAIVGGASISDRVLLAQIVTSIMLKTSPTTTNAAFYTAIAASIAAKFKEFATGMRDSSTGETIGAGGNYQPGNFWCYQGSGASADVPGMGAGDVTGLSSVAVTMHPHSAGYYYRVEVNVDVYSTVANYVNTGGNWTILVLGSSDGGVTFPTPIASEPTGYGPPGVGLLRALVSPSAAIDHLKVQLQRSTAAAADLVYSPSDSQITVTELLPV
jgi:hypothetical protein